VAVFNRRLLLYIYIYIYICIIFICACEVAKSSQCTYTLSVRLQLYVSGEVCGVWCVEIMTLAVSVLLEFGGWVLWTLVMVLLLARSELYHLLAPTLALFILALCVLS